MKLDHLILFASIVAVLGAIVYSISSPFPVTRFTEFYVYPDPTNFTYGITNYEGKHVTYRVEGYFIEGETDKGLPMFDETVGLAYRETFISQVIDGPPQSGVIVLELYKKDLPQTLPYRTLHFAVSGSEEGGHEE